MTPPQIMLYKIHHAKKLRKHHRLIPLAHPFQMLHQRHHLGTANKTLPIQIHPKPIIPGQMQQILLSQQLTTDGAFSRFLDLTDNTAFAENVQTAAYYWGLGRVHAD
jgi:hypothetical protein